MKTLKTKGNNLEKKIRDATTLIHINQYKTDKQKLREENWGCWKKDTTISHKIFDTNSSFHEKF